MIRRRSTRSPISLRKMACAAWVCGPSAWKVRIRRWSAPWTASLRPSPTPPPLRPRPRPRRLRPLRRRHPPRPRRVEPPVKVARARPGGLRSLSPRRPSSGRSRPSPWSPSKTALRRRLPLHLPRRASRCVWWRHPPCPAQAARHPFPLASTTTSTAAGISPPFPGAIVVGLLRGLVVQNDSALSCLENANQSDELGSSSAVTTTPELVVWQWPGNQQYLYVVAATSPGSTSADCASATLAFPEPSATSASGLAAS